MVQFLLFITRCVASGKLLAMAYRGAGFKKNYEKLHLNLDIGLLN